MHPNDLTQRRAILASELANRRAEAQNPRRTALERALLASMAEDSAAKLAALRPRLELADVGGLDWAQAQVSAHHYLHTPVDSRCRPLAYLVCCGETKLGCLIFGRPEATRCYTGKLTYGSQADVASGRARFDRWELINLARVWLDPALQHGGALYEPNAATWAIGQALKRVVTDYLLTYPPIYLEQPWKLRVCLSYCDTRVHQGTIYRAAGFQLARTNENGIETWMRPLRGLQGHERQQIERVAGQSARGRRYRSREAAEQLVMEVAA